MIFKAFGVYKFDSFERFQAIGYWTDSQAGGVCETWPLKLAQLT